MTLRLEQPKFPETTDALQALSVGWQLTMGATPLRSPIEPGFWNALFPDGEVRKLEVKFEVMRDNENIFARIIAPDYVGPWFRPSLTYITKWTKQDKPKAT